MRGTEENPGFYSGQTQIRSRKSALALALTLGSNNGLNFIFQMSGIPKLIMSNAISSDYSSGMYDISRNMYTGEGLGARFQNPDSSQWLFVVDGSIFGQGIEEPDLFG